MPTPRPLALAALTVLFLASCVSLPAGPREPASVLLVSIDGFRADYLDLGITPNLSRVAREGVRAQWMNPSYPTLTFPNHYTMVTGLRPDHHGIVHNTMSDPVLGTFDQAVGDGRWWQHYDGNVSMDKRVDTVLGWLNEPTATRPRFTTLYFDALDHAGHDFGPDAPQTRTTISDIDTAIGRLLAGLSSGELKPRVNVVIVSDHGMATMPAGQAIAIEDMVDPADARRVTSGEVVGFTPLPGHERAAEARLLGRHAHYECWRKSELPPHWHYGTHPRIPPILCQTDVGWQAIPRQSLDARAKQGTRGAHGFAPESPTMRALFIAQGPAFRTGATLPPFDNVDVYPLLAKLIGIAPVANDGDLAPLLPALRDEAAR